MHVEMMAFGQVYIIIQNGFNIGIKTDWKWEVTFLVILQVRIMVFLETMNPLGK
jgi:hypothetical protein